MITIDDILARRSAVFLGALYDVIDAGSLPVSTLYAKWYSGVSYPRISFLHSYKRFDAMCNEFTVDCPFSLNGDIISFVGSKEDGEKMSATIKAITESKVRRHRY